MAPDWLWGGLVHLNLYIDFISVTKKFQLGRHPATRRRCSAKLIGKLTKDASNIFLSFFNFWKRMLSNCLKNSRSIEVFDSSCFNWKKNISNRHHTATYRQHSVYYTLHLHLQIPLNLIMYTSYYTVNIVRCTSHVYTEFCKCIISHCKHQQFVRVGFKIFMAKFFLINPN